MMMIHVSFGVLVCVGFPAKKYTNRSGCIWSSLTAGSTSAKETLAVQLHREHSTLRPNGLPRGSCGYASALIGASMC